MKSLSRSLIRAFFLVALSAGLTESPSALLAQTPKRTPEEQAAITAVG